MRVHAVVLGVALTTVKCLSFVLPVLVKRPASAPLYNPKASGAHRVRFSCASAPSPHAHSAVTTAEDFLPDSQTLAEVMIVS